MDDADDEPVWIDPDKNKILNDNNNSNNNKKKYEKKNPLPLSSDQNTKSKKVPKSSSQKKPEIHSKRKPKKEDEDEEYEPEHDPDEDFVPSKNGIHTYFPPEGRTYGLRHKVPKSSESSLHSLEEYGDEWDFPRSE